MRLRATNGQTAIEYHSPDPMPQAEFWFPVSLLADCEGRTQEPVTLEPVARSELVAHWQDRRLPRVAEYDAKAPSWPFVFPDEPVQYSSNPPRLWEALGQAMAATDREACRYALGCLQLRGSQKQIAATDGRQLIALAGFEFPWEDELLVEGLPLLGWSGLATEQPVNIGRTDEWVVLVLGPWKLGLKIQTEGRFPTIERVIPDPSSVISTLVISDADAEFLIQSLPKLPGRDQDRQPVTIELGREVLLRSFDESQAKVTELVLNGSRREGEPLTWSTDRRYLLRALELGLRQVQLTGGDGIVWCQGEQSQYLWMPLGPEQAVKPSANCIRVESGSVPASTLPAPSTVSVQPKPRRKSAVTSQPDSAAPATKTKRTQRPIPSGSTIEQAIALRDALKAAANHANDLARTLKRQRRENQVVQSTLASLRELGRFAA
jgi:hypothetical protein